MQTKKVILSIVETMLANIVIYFLFYKIQPNQDLYLRLNPHPLIMLGIIFSIRYGNYLGVFFALVSSIFYGVVFYKINGELVSLFINLKNYKFVLIIFWSGMIFGTLKDNYKANIEKLTNKNRLLLDNYKKLNSTHRLTQEVLDELKKQIINSEESILQLYEIASSLETFNSEEIYTETVGIISKYLRAETVSVYTYDESSSYMRLKIRMGSSINEKRSLNISNSEGFRKVVFEKQVIRLSDVDDDNFPLMSAPLVRDNKVVAVVNIESMNFDDLSEYAFQLFKIIIDWVNKALEQAVYVDNLSDSKYYTGMKLMKYDAFIERVEEEERRKREFGMEYSILKYRVNNMNLEDINNKIGRELRAVDVISYDSVGGILYILLPATPQSNCFIVDQRIKDELKHRVEKLDDVYEEVAVGLIK